jgi:CheY-like chemotaxis protein
MSLVRVAIGPVPAASARAWVTSARSTLATVRERDLGVPADVLDAFDVYVELWSAIADTTEPFEWSGEIDSDMLRHLAAHWARLVTMARSDPGSGLRTAGPEAEEFFEALASAIVEASAVDDRDNISERLGEVIPAFAETVEVDSPGSARRVLLVDDNEDIRLLMRLAIERDRRLVVVGEAANGADALAKCDGACPDAVLLDLLMPVMDGYEALPKIKQRCPRTDVVVFSAMTSPETTARVASLGAAAFVEKTADTVAVLDALAGAV